MNLALGVLIIFIIAIPGIVFRLTYLSSPYSKRWISTTAVEEIFNSLVPAFVFHTVFILIIDRFSHYTVDFQFIYNLLIGNATAKNIDDLNKYLGHFTLYIALNIAVNFMTAYILRRLVLKHRWYEKIQFLSIYSKWYFKLKQPFNDGEKISVWIDLLVETKNESIIYRGFLTDFWLNKDGNIDELHFENVRRRVFNNDEKYNTLFDNTEGMSVKDEDDIPVFEPTSGKSVDERYYYIPGELFIIKYSDVKNMNISYFAESISDS